MLSRWALVAFVGSLFAAGCGGESSGGSGDVASGDATAAAADAPHPGEKTYQEFCFSCHTPGLSGAPKLGDADAWAPRIAKGKELLLKSTIEGIAPAMPPRGICMSCSDEELAVAIDYMIEKSQ
jgi:cytochrome c5